MKERNTFLCYKDWITYFEDPEDPEALDDPETIAAAGDLFIAILRYQNGEKDARPRDAGNRRAFNKIRSIMDQDAEKYAAECAKNAENIRKRWQRKKAEQLAADQEAQDEPGPAAVSAADTDTDTAGDIDNTTIPESIRPYTTVYARNNDTDTDTESPNGDKRERPPKGAKRESAKKRAFPAHTLDDVRTVFESPEIKELCERRGVKADPEQMYNYYAMQGWKRGGGYIQDLTACARNWIFREQGIQNRRERERRNAAFSDIPQHPPESTKECFERLKARGCLV